VDVVEGVVTQPPLQKKSLDLPPAIADHLPMPLSSAVLLPMYRKKVASNFSPYQLSFVMRAHLVVPPLMYAITRSCSTLLDVTLLVAGFPLKTQNLELFGHSLCPCLSSFL